MEQLPPSLNSDSNSSDSGLICFVLLCRYHNVAADSAQLVHEYQIDEKSFGVSKMVLAAKKLGLKSKSAFFTLDRLEKLALPAIARAKDDTFFILLKYENQQFLIQNPLLKKIENLSLSQLQERWSGELVLFTSRASLAQEFKKFDFTWFIPAVIKHRGLLSEVLAVSFVIQLLGLLMPLFFQVVMDKVLVHRGWSTLNVIAFAMAVVSIFSVVLTALRSYVFSHTSSRIDVELGARMFRHLLQLPIHYFKTRRVGDTIARVRELENIRQFLTGNALTLVLDLVFSVIFIAVMFFYSWSLTLIVIFSIPIYVGISIFSMPVLRAKLNEKFNRGAENQSFLVETVSGIETVKAMSLEPQMRQKWENQLSTYITAGFQTGNWSNIASNAVSLTSKLVTVATLWWGAHLVIDGQISVGQLIAFNMLSGQVAQPILRLSQLWTDFQQIGISMQRLGDILSSATENSTQSRSTMPMLRGEIIFDNVSFSYRSDSSAVLRQINLKIMPNEFIGIVGRSGSGKSTLTKLIQRLYVPQSGRVLVDGMDLALADVSSLRRQLGVVLQENFLFNRSIRENIALADPGSNIERVISAAKLAGAHDFILEQPQGYDTIIQEQGSSLSGGQRQRIAIARALLTNPRILIFDEATSALDYESEHIIHKNMASICRGRTVIVIAHRLSAVKNANRILVLEKGQIVEQGNHQELMQLEGVYQYLYQLQSGA